MTILMSLSTVLLSLLIFPPLLTSCALVAAAAGEVAKDAKYLTAVEKVGGDFIPLVVESCDQDIFCTVNY